MTTVKVVRLYNEILENEKVEIIFEKNGRTFCGALFWEEEPDSKILEVLDTAEIEDKFERNEVLNCIQKYIEFSVKYEKETFKDTLATMLHWQLMNGFSKEVF